ncbi:hypothetical protein A8C75_05455 [Marinobacterium aestuarii]|uniref:DUF6788 domain-containing protein n=1 Tax=Marinobacterium aestuarii TaxID=1821621 RepID=A0A1A9EVQ5_9GAMM|nr:DUF6788 family protein [Marinobacterium aestuarii]ANG61986.1 hypothetical protein A8C75_05455 [Marinobacterium aestuarii]
MQDKASASLRRRRKALLRQLPPLEAVLRGSLIERYKRCGKPGCKCAKGPGHGPKYYLSVSRTGARPQMDYVPQDYQAQVTAYLDNYRRIREILDELCAINRELLHRREAF